MVEDATQSRWQVPEPSDRALLIAALNAICTLAESLTGKRMVLKIGNDRGDQFSFYGAKFEMEDAGLTPFSPEPPPRPEQLSSGPKGP